jgi:hypothetical protein
MQIIIQEIVDAIVRTQSTVDKFVTLEMVA